MGGNLISYPGNVSTPTANMTTAKVVINSTISYPFARWLCLDINDFYLNNVMKRPEYARIPYQLIPLKIKIQSKLNQYVVNGYVYFEVTKGMYRLPKAGIIAYEALKKEHLAPHG